MKIGFYPKLAWTSLGKSRRFNFPYILTAAFIIFAYYTLAFLSSSDISQNMPGMSSFQAILNFGAYVMMVFGALFLFYTYSFLMKKRTRELGLYNILGLSKRNLITILFWENLYMAVASIVSGLGLGILLSKLMELWVVNMANGIIDYKFRISYDAVKKTVIDFLIIFLVLFISGAIKILKSKTTELLHGDNYGEKPPKANWVIGFGGIILLGGAYWLAVSINDPLTAIVWFFVAVIMVIVGTYMIFVSASVMVCRILQKNKAYYYKADHFISVSSMAYRMKRNGAGLASICILLTMVLVIISSTSCLYFGSDEAIRTRFARQITGFSSRVGYGENDDAYFDTLNKSADEYVGNLPYTICNTCNYMEYTVIGFLRNESGIERIEPRDGVTIVGLESAATIHILPISVYNEIAGTNLNLGAGEAYSCSIRTDEIKDKFVLGEREIIIKGNVPVPDIEGTSPAEMVAVVFLFVNDANFEMGEISKYFNYNDIYYRFIYYFDTDGDEAAQVRIGEELNKIFKENWPEGASSSYADSREANKEDFFQTFGALFFIGILLSFVYIVMAVLIIYYKQINEGYEDQARFEIMKKVGMTKEEIKASINSQMKMVFLLPIVFACMHLAFAFPFLSKILLLFAIYNQKLLLCVTALTVLVIAIAYLIAYKLTTKVYFSIVNEAR